MSEAGPAVTTDAEAERVVRYMYEHDPASCGAGMVLESAGIGRARLSMQVRADMMNGHGTCHGGFVFMLADSAFQFACNSRNELTVAAADAIEFVRPGHTGDVLTAEAVERSLAGRSGVYDIAVTNQAGDIVALFRGKSRRIRGTVVPEAPETPEAESSR